MPFYQYLGGFYTMSGGNRKNLSRALIFSAVASILPSAAWAEFYKYTDRDGVIHFVDDPAKIPRQYSKKTKTYGYDHADVNVTKVHIIGNQVLVPATLVYDDRQVQVTLLLDTGASITAVYSEIVGGLNLDGTKTIPITGRVAGGGTVSGSRARLDRIEVGSRSISDFDIAVIPHDGPRENHDGLLGMNFLRNYQYRIDFENQLIHWR